MESFREKYLQDHLTKIDKNKSKLTSWEKEFISNIKLRLNNRMVITRPQYNTVKEIADKL